MIHSFDTNIASKYGINCAVVLQNIYFWIEKNRANETNYFEGNYWTYNTKKAFTDLFPYMTERQIRYCLDKLVEENILITGNFNEDGRDRTLWYAITDFGYSILQNCQMQKTKLSNAKDKIVQALPYSKHTYNKHTNNNNIKDNKKFLKEKEIVEPQEEIEDIKAEPMALTTEVVEPKNEIARQDDINFDEILNHWNSLDIIHHKKMTLKTQKKIKDLIKNKELTLEELYFAMDRYNQMLKDENYFFKYKWSLEDFITREKGVKEFKDDGGKWLNYLNSPSGKRFEEQETFSNLDMSDWLGGNKNVR